MSFANPPALLRRTVVAVVAALCLVTPTFLGATTPVAAASGSSFDSTLGRGDCELLGRVFKSGSGCSRTQCVKGARHFRITFGAEACQLRGQGGYGFAATIDSRRCVALGRHWIPQVNYCAAYPDRSPDAVYNALQCTAPRTVYVHLTEEDGYYDECLTPERVRELLLLAQVDGSTLTQEASDRSSVQCPYRPNSTYQLGRCVHSAGPRPSTGGVLWIGDSLTWRGTDELGRLRPTFSLDGEPGRRLTSLQDQLDYFRSGHGEPTGFVLELGTVPARSFKKKVLTKIVKSLPSSTDVMFVLPYAELSSDPVRVSKKTVKVGKWYKTLSRSHKHACLADWPAYVHSHPGVLQDGVHVKHKYEDDWAAWASQAWSRCF